MRYLLHRASQVNGAELVGHGMNYGPIFGKVHRMILNDLDMLKVKNRNMHATYTARPKFTSILHDDEPF